MATIHATAAEFNTAIQQNDVVLADFFATWCGPCKMIAPFIEMVSEEYEGEAVVLKIDVDEEPDLAAQFGVESIPTVVLFKNGQAIRVEVGAHNKDFYAEMIESAL